MKSSLIIIALILSVFIPAFAPAADFTATTLGDYGNVTVMEVTGNYDANNPDGSINSDPRKTIAKEFYRLHKDEYDFLVMFSNFDFQMPDPAAKAFYLHVKNDTRGIGQQIFDNSALFGSNGKLQGTIDMGDISALTTDPLDMNFERSLDILSHELMHRWGSYVKFMAAQGIVSAGLLGKDLSHWSFLLNSYASLLYGNQWQDNGNGTFTSLLASRKYYSPLDLYLMGFIDKSQVPPMLLIDNPDIDPKQMPETGITISGRPTYVTIDQIIAAEGERIPGPSESQKSFKTAFIFLTAPGTFTGDELYGIENIRNGWVTRYSVLSDGKGIMEVASVLREDVPTNPGTTPPSVTPRTLPPNVEEGVTWLMNDQKAAGNWLDIAQTAERDTTEVVLALKNFAVAQQNYNLGLQWLNGTASGNTDYLSRKIEVMAQAGQDVTLLLQTLISRQNLDGGWGSKDEYMSSAADTALVLKAFSASGYADQSVIGKAISYLKTKQNPDQGWGSDNASTIQTTANVLTAFKSLKLSADSYQLTDFITNGLAWLAAKQNPDGGFGPSADSGQAGPSTIYDTALTLLTLGAFDISRDITNKAVQYILSSQSENGSWLESPYQTALAIEAVWKATVDPDLSIKNTDITFIPANISSLPSNIVINSVIWNSGRTGVAAAKVALYEGAISDAAKIGEQTVAFPGQSTVTITFNAVARNGSEHRFYIVVDPENLIKEPNEANNTAIGILHPLATYDFEVLSSDNSLSANPVDIFKDLKITSKITNKGTMNAYNVQVKYFIDEAGAPFEIATSTVNIPAGATITNEVIWRTNKAGQNLPLTVFADPFNTFAEISEENNKAVTQLTVNGSTEPNLTISYKDMVITPSPANERGNANISILVKNEGFSTASNIQVNFYKGVPGVDGILLGSQVIPSLNTGESSRITFDWTDIMDAGERIIYIKVDPFGQITEISKDDNDAFVVLDILSLPDLAISTNSITFSPPAPKDGDTVAIMVTIKNLGRQSASNISVRAVDGNTIIGTKTIPIIAGNSQETVSFSYDTTGKSGAHQVTVVADPDHVIVEQSEDNNTASRTFGVQNANLWLTELYISPNGDGIKDSTQLFFRLDVQQTVKVTIVNKRGEIVRTFTGAELTDIPGGNTIWDGLNDIGTVVADGQYQIKVVDLNNNVLGSLLVIVDNNRSPLSDALGTKYLLNNNLTCGLPDIDQENWKWFPDESGIVFNIANPNPNTPEYPTGLYTMAPDGEDIFRLIPWDWQYSSEQGSIAPYHYSLVKYQLSPDGESIAFALNKINKTPWRYELSQLWVVDRYGKNLKLVDSYDQLQTPYSDIRDLKWSPNGQYIAYLADNPTALWVIKPDGTGKTMIDPDGGYIDFTHVTWSPDSRRIAYVLDAYDANYNRTPKVRVAGIAGNNNEILTTSQYPHYLEWLGNQKVILSIPDEITGSSALWLIAVDGLTSRKISNNYWQVSISPDRKSFSFYENVDNSNLLVILSDERGELSSVYETPINANMGEGIYYSSGLTNMIWSRDGQKLAFVDNNYKAIDSCISEAAAIVVDASTKKKTAQKVFDGEYTYSYSYSYSYSYDPRCADPNSYKINEVNQLVSWLPDNANILISSQNGYFDLDTEAGERGGYIPLDASIAAISPYGRYINYYKSVDQSSVCYGRGFSDLWAMSSLLNLTADLRLVKNKSAIILKGTAADLNFEGYMLEYADTKSPAAWNLVKPPSDVPVINDVFTTWVPPYEGFFYVRLTVWDRAGNIAREQKRVSWGLSSSITNLYKSAEIFSPNGDGTKDTVSLNYTVLEPVHLEFYIHDKDNNRIRTFYKDYTAAGADSIIWDGRDAYGNLVPDGKYTIKIFDYEFFAELDNTPPDVNLALSEIRQDITWPGSPYNKCAYPYLITPLIVYLTGHAYDKNLKNWIVEYGEGDNPQEWRTQLKGQDPLVGIDEEGNPILQPIKDVEIGYYINQSIAGLTGKKFRITVEDHAGNRGSIVSNMIEEKIRLYFHSWGDECDHEYIKVGGRYPSLNLPVVHALEGIETIGADLISMNLQYRSGFQWNDAENVESSADGDFNFEWDRSKVLSEINAVRLKGVDIYGQEHYSNIVETESLFNIDRCGAIPTGFNFLFEKLTVLKIQIQSDQDSRFAQWTDYEIINAPYVPTGIFSLAALSDIRWMNIRMIGIGESGTQYVGGVGPSNPKDCPDETGAFEFKLAIKDYAEANCGMVSDGATALTAGLLIRGKSPKAKFENLSYYIENSDGPELLREFDLTKVWWGDVDIQTSAMAEGSYPVRAVLNYFDTHDYKDKELSADGTLIVDRILPEAKVTYPDKAQTLCPSKLTDAKGEWFVVPVEGIAQDNTGVKRYELYYGFGEAPQEWKPALKRIIEKNVVKYVPITGKAVKGKLGDWYVEGIHGTVSLKLKVVDVTGNVTCYTTTFTVKDVVDFANPSVDKSLFSPNGDGFFDDVNVTYEITEYATIDLKVYPLTLISWEYVLGQSPVGTIASGISHLGGEGYAVWDGMVDAGSALDGHYGIAVLATDSCGNTRTRWTPVEVDNTLPLAIISYPMPGNIIGNIVEVKGTVSDSHFKNYVLDAAPAGSINEWRLISNSSYQVMDKILGKWNTYGLTGIWTLRLTAFDTVGNKNETSVDIDLGERKDLIKDLNVTPKIFSPNHDGKMDNAAIRYELSYPSNIKIEMFDSAGTVRKTYTTTTPSLGSYTYIWDGSDTAGITVPDGTYVVKLTAALTANPSVNQFEASTVIVDTKAPVIDIKQPVSGSYIKTTDISVNGSLSDPNIMEYSMTVLSDVGLEMLDQGNQDRTAYHFGTLSNPAEGAYTLDIKAKDLAENSVEENILFVIDRTPPRVALDTPKSGDYFGNNKTEISVTGSIEEKNLESFELRYGLGDTPLQWTELLKGTTLSTVSQIYTWKVGKNDNIQDGKYSLSLLVKDKAGLTGESKVSVIVDNTKPETVISSPVDGSYVKSALDIKGTAFDANLDKYTVELSEGNCQSAFKWSALMSSTKSIKDGVLARMQILPADGDYCIRVSAIDKLENRSEARAKITIDTQPPAAPVLSGKIENRTDVRLTWAANTEPDIAGYDLYREGKKLNTTLLVGLSYLDAGLTEGTYSYTLKAVDHAGNESKSSNGVTIKIDLTGPNARLRAPQDSARVSGLVDIKGTAYSADDFKEYRLFIGRGQSPSAWMLIRTSPVPETYGVLAQWDTAGLAEDEHYSIKLEAADINGNTSGHQITVTIDNRPPAAPLLLAAVPSVSDVQLTWNANTEQDLAGYLLYRNDQLANVQGIVIGNLKPYLIATTAYSDKGLPDGSYKYSLVAMDIAGNMSDQSNILEVTIDTRPPHAVIVEPGNNTKFDKTLMVKAESPDTDIATVSFQYKKAQDTAWLDLGNPMLTLPYAAHLDPSALGLAFADYHIRAVATDKGGKTDPAPAYITVTYTDVTAPALPLELKALANGADVTLTWISSQGGDLDGYNIYRISGGTKQKINATVVRDTTYRDGNLADGSYAYEATSIDTAGNESKPSNSVSARIYAPLLVHPYTPTGNTVLPLTGSNAAANATVQIFVEAVSGPELRGTATSDALGNFTADTTLALVENRITAIATDAAGNTSRVSDMVVVVYNETPSAPTGLMNSVQNHDVSLSWGSNAESDLSGYNIYRDGEKINTPVSVASGVVTASSSDYYNPASNAFDFNPGTAWISYTGYGVFNPTWIQIDLPTPELLSRVDINWLGDSYAGKDYEIQAWSGYAWITQKKVIGNVSIVNAFDFKPSYRSDKIRIQITDVVNTGYYKQAGISEISLFRDNLITETSYHDLDLSDGKYSYSITAVDYYGFESLPSESSMADIGDVLPPAAPIELAATVSGADIILDWTPNTEPDLQGYHIYRNTSQGWIKLSTSLIPANTFTDPSLVNNTYSYRVTAVDSIGNESQPSNETIATVYVPDITPPSKPVLFFPTIAGLPVVVYDGRTDVSGFAEPGSSVTIFKDGVLAGTTTALAADLKQSYPLDMSWGDVVPSPDSKAFVFGESNGSLWLRDIASGSIRQMTQYGYSPVWSSDGTKIAFQYDEVRSGQQNYLIGIYDIRSGAVTTLTDTTADPYIDEYSPSMSSDGSRIAFVSYQGGSYNVWLKDFISGTVKQLTYGRYLETLKLSPDGNRLAYIDGGNSYLYVADIASGESVIIDNNSTGDSLDWSPDSGTLLFSSSVNGNVDLYSYNLSTNGRTQLTSTADYEFSAQWSPDGKSILFGQYDSNGNISVRLIRSEAPNGDRLLFSPPGFYGLYWLKSGAISYADGSALTVVQPKGLFRQKDISLDAGENLLSAVSTDSSGNLSQPSDEISVTFETSHLPDLEILSSDIYLYPPVPVEGQQLLLNIAVWNRGQTGASDVAADVYIWDVTGNLQRIKSVIIPILAPGSGEIIAVSWDTSGKKGANRLFVVLDPADAILEQREDNNIGEKEFFVTAGEGVSMTTALNAGQFTRGQDVAIDIHIVNSGAVWEGVIDVLIEDENGYPVAILDSRDTNLAYGSQKHYAYSWNTGSIYSGQYRVHTIVRDASGILAEKIVPFTILPEIAIEASVVTDKALYGANENVQTTVLLNNKGLNYIIPELKVNYVVTNEAGTGLFEEEKIVNNILPGASVSFNPVWNTGLAAPGIYHAAINIYYNGQVILSKTAPFSIESVVTVSGSLQVAPSVVLLGNTVQADYAVLNSGNSDAMGLLVRVIVVDPETATTMMTAEETVDLQINKSGAGRFVFPTQGFGLKTYKASLQYIYQGSTKTLSSSLFAVIDGALPVVNVVSPVSGSLFNTKVDMVVTATDDASGIKSVEYQIDNGLWRLLPVADIAMGRYMTVWTPSQPDEGTHTISFRATDRSGNMSQPVSSTITADMTPPASAVTSPVSGSKIMGTTITIEGTSSDAGSTVQSVEVSTDGGATWSRAEGTTSWSYAWNVPADGQYTLRSRATDVVGNIEIPGEGSTVTVYRRQSSNVSVSGWQLLVNGNPFTMKGVIYSPVPVGDDVETTPPFGDYFTADYNDIYDRDLPLLRQMGTNVLNLLIWDGTEDHLDFLDRSYNNGLHPIYVIAGYWINPGLDIDPQSPGNVRAQLKSDFREMVATHKNHPAILMWAIGNDLNADVMYGAELPDLFSLINEMAAEAHAEERSNFHPVTTALTDINLIPTISAYNAMTPSLDVWGANVYRGATFGTLFNDFKAVSSKPLAILGYGIDAFDNANGDEYENIGVPEQAMYAEALWNEIKLRSDVCIGGSIKEYSDEWWKGKYSTGAGCSDADPALHSACGHAADYTPDAYDNEEWWGIMRTAPNPSGPDSMEAGVLYYTLQELWVESTNSPQISVNPTAADFGSTALGSAALAQTFTLSNAGTENLALGAITILGAHGSEFQVQGDRCSGRVLIPSKTCTLQVVFLATTAGAKSAMLSIPSDDQGVPIKYAELTGLSTVSLSGAITSGGSALSGVTVTLSGTGSATTTADSLGNYTFSGLVNGSYTVTPGKTGYAFTPPSKAVTINNADVTGQNFTGALITFTLMPSSGSGGSISPSTPQIVSYNGTVSFTVAPGAGYRISDVMVDGISQGAISSYTFSNVTANHTIDASFASTNTSIKFGVFGATSVKLSGGAYVDSYDSSKGPYIGAHGANGSVGTNATARGAITMSGGAKVYGNAWVGPGGNPATAITMSGCAVISGTRAALPSAIDMTPRTDPGGGVATTFTNGTIFTSGTYRVSSISLSGKGVGTINGNVTLYVTGSITVSGQAKIVITPGSSLTVYVGGSMHISGGGIVNQTFNPHSLIIYGTSTCTNASFSGSSSLYGVIHAPKASTSISGGSSLYGSLIGGSITVSGGAAVHYDESLRK